MVFSHWNHHRHPGFNACCVSIHSRIINNNNESWKFQKNQRKNNIDFIGTFHVSPRRWMAELIWMQISFDDIVLWLSAHSSPVAIHRLKKWEWEKKKWSGEVCTNCMVDHGCVIDFESNNERKPVFNTRKESNKQHHKMLNILTQTRSPSIVGIVIVDLCDHGAKIQCASTSELSYSQVAYYVHNVNNVTTKVNKLKFSIILKIIWTESWKGHFRGKLYLQDFVLLHDSITPESYNA